MSPALQTLAERVDAYLWPERRLAHHARGQRRLSNAELGRLGERVAARWVRRSGRRLLARRLVTREAELDLVSRREEHLYVHEVKTGFRSRAFTPGDHLDDEQRARLLRATRALARHTGSTGWTLELLEVVLDRRGEIQVEATTLEARLT